MALLSTQAIALAGLNPAYAACAGGGDEFVPNRRTFIHVKNGHSSPQSVTVVTPRTQRGLAIADVVVSVPNAGERMIGPFNAEEFGDPVDGRADISYSGVTNLTIAVVELPEISE
jgi:hypothetical protein